MAEAVESGASGSKDHGCPAPSTPKAKSSTSKDVPLLATPDRLTLDVDTRLPPGWRRKVSQRMLGNSAGTYDVYIFGPDGKKFRSCAEIERHVAENGLESELDCYVFDFSPFGTNNLTLRARREALATPKKSVKKKPAVSKVAHKLIKQKSIAGKKKLPAMKKKVVVKKAPVKTFGQKLVVKMDFLSRKRSATENEESESEASDGDEEEVAAEDIPGEKTTNKKRKVDAKQSSSPKKKTVDKAASPHKTPKKGAELSSGDEMPVLNGHAKGDDIENTQTGEAMDSAVNGGGDHNEQNNNEEPEQEMASPRKRANSKTRKDSGTPLKEVNNAAARHPNTPLSPSGRRGRSSSRDSLTAQSPRRKSATALYTDEDVSFQTPTKQKRSRLSKDSADEEALMESPGDLSHGQVDGAAADTPPRRGRGRPRKDGSEAETPAKVGRGRPRKFPLNSPKQAVEAMETETPPKEVKRSQRGADKEQTGEGSAAGGDNISPMKRTRGRPKSQIQPVESEPESVNPQENAEPVKKKRGRPRKSLPDSVEDSNDVKLDQSEPVKESTEANKVEISEESPVKRGRGRPRKFPRTPGQSTSKVSATGEKPALSVLKTPAHVPKKRLVSESNKEDESVIEPSTKKTPASTSKAKVPDMPDDSIIESPVRRSRGRPRKIPVVDFSEKRPRARPQREVVESKEESNVIVTTAEIHREQSDDDELPTLTYEGKPDSPPPETNLHKEPPLLVLSSNITATDDDSIEPDPELPVLVSMSPRKSARKPKPYFHKDFVSPTRKLISSYEQGRASTKKDQTVKAVGTPKRGRPRKVSEPVPEPEQLSKTPKRVAKLSEQTNNLQKAVSESENNIPSSGRVARKEHDTSAEESVEETNECVNEVKRVIRPTGTKKGVGVKSKVKGIESVSANVVKKGTVSATEASVSGARGKAVKGISTHKVEGVEGVSNVAVDNVTEHVVADAEEPPELMPMDSVSAVEEPMLYTCVVEMDPAVRALLSAMLLDHAYTNSLTYSLPPEVIPEPAPPVLEQTENTAAEDVLGVDSQTTSLLSATEMSNMLDAVAFESFLEEPPMEPNAEEALNATNYKPKLIAAVSTVKETSDRVMATVPTEQSKLVVPVAEEPKITPAAEETKDLRTDVSEADEPKAAPPSVTAAEASKVATASVPEVDEPKAEELTFVKLSVPKGEKLPLAMTNVPRADEPLVATTNVPGTEDPNLALTSIPATEETEAAATSVPVAEEPKMVTSVPVAEEPKMATSVPVAEEPKMATNVPLGEQPNMATSEPVTDETKMATSVPVTDEPKIGTSVSVTDEQKLGTSVPKVEALTEEPQTSVRLPAMEEPKVETSSEPAAEEPMAAMPSVPVAEEPKDATSVQEPTSVPVAEALKEPTIVQEPTSVPLAEELKEPTIVQESTIVAVAGEPKVTMPVVPATEEAKTATAIVSGAEKTTASSADSPLFERFLSITPVSTVVEKPKTIVATSPMAKNLKAIVANSAVAGRLKAMTAMTADKSKVVTVTLAGAEKPKAVNVVAVEQSQVMEKTLTESKPPVKVKVTADSVATVGNKSAEDTLAKVKAGVKRKADIETVATPVKFTKVQDKSTPGPSATVVSKVKLKTKQGLVAEKTSPSKLGLSPGTLPRDMSTGVAGLVKPLGIKGTVIVRKNPKVVPPVKKGLTPPKNVETTSLAKLEKSLKGMKSPEKVVCVGQKKAPGHKGGEVSPVKSKKSKLHLKETERAALLKQKKGDAASHLHQKKGLHGHSPDAEKSGHVKHKKHMKHGEMVPLGLHKKGDKLSKKLSPEKRKQGHVGFKEGLKTSPEMPKKGIHRRKDSHKVTPDKLKKSIHVMKDGDRHKSAIRTHKGLHALKDSDRKTPDKHKKVTLSLKGSDRAPSEKPPKGILSIKDSEKSSADKPLKGIIAVKECEKTPSDKPLKGILSVKSSEKVKPKKLSLTISTEEPESSAPKSSESAQTPTKSSTTESTDNTDKTPDKSNLTPKNDQTETKSPNGTRRVSIGGVEINEIDQTKSPGPPSTSFDLASLAFAPPTPKLNKRRKSSDSKSPKIKKVGGTWSFTPLSKMPPASPKPDMPETTAIASTSSKETASSSGTGPKSILKKS